MKEKVEVKYRNRITWLTDGLKRSINHKNKLYMKYRKGNCPESKTHYMKYKTTLNMVLKREERSYYRLKLKEHSNNMKKSWDVLKTVINKKRKVNKNNLKFLINGKLIEDDDTISNSFNEFFVNIVRGIVCH